MIGNGGSETPKKKYKGKSVRKPKPNGPESSDDIPNKQFNEFESCDRATLELYKSKLQLEIGNLNQTKSVIEQKKEIVHLRMINLECREQLLKDKIRLLRSHLNEINLASDGRNEINNIPPEDVSSNSNIHINDKSKNAEAAKEKEASKLPRKSFQGLKVKLVNFILSKYGEDVSVNNVKRITSQTARTISSENTEVVTVYLLKTNKIMIRSIHSLRLSKFQFTAKRNYAIKWKRKLDSDIKNAIQPVLVDDDEDIREAVSLVVLKPLSEQETLCLSKTFHIGVLHNVSVNEDFQLICEDPFQIKPINGSDVVLNKTQIDVIRPIVLKSLENTKLSGTNGGSIPSISIMTKSSLQSKNICESPTNATRKRQLESNDPQASSASSSKKSVKLNTDLLTFEISDSE